MRLGILGGTFDPVHMGHLIIGEEARLQLRLDRVVFVPTGNPYLRPEQPRAKAHHRLAMVRIAIADNPAFSASDLEVAREGPTYTVDTLRQLQAQEPPGTELFFICGQDSLRDLPRWHRPAELAALCTLVVAPRPGAEAATPGSIQALLPGVKLRCKVLHSPLMGISGTELRRRLGTGESVRYWLPSGVLDYIKEHNLYAGASG